MNVARLVTRPCTLVLRSDAATPDEYNDETYTETEVETVCELQQEQAVEQATGGIILTDRWHLFLLPTETVDGLAAVQVDGDTFELDGPPWHARHPVTGEATHIEATARRVA